MVKVTRHLSVGPGGRKCNCCFPPPGSPCRKAKFRTAKRRSQAETRRQIRCDLVD